MTATHVNGVEVYAVEPYPSPIPGPHGEKLYFKQTVRILLANGQELAGCVHCDYTSENWRSIRPHLGGCKVKKAKEAKEAAAKGSVQPAAPAQQPIWMERAMPTIKEREDWPINRAKPAARPAQPETPAPSASRAAVDLQNILDRLATIPELEERVRRLESDRDRWRNEAMEMRAFVNPLLTRIDGKPRRANAKVVF
ncbi:hypothetical protein [Micromonospora sp. NPDC047730]|uniref:hypothetical protein n=1 Tax=Micromonospora sp. NPDC047730 TaxID=3364253 RepID=UPI003712323C